MDATLISDPGIRLAAATLIATALVDWMLRRVRRHIEAKPASKSAANPSIGSKREWLHVIIPPLSLGVWFYGVYLAARIITSVTLPVRLAALKEILEQISGLGAFVTSLWLLHRCAKLLEKRLQGRARRTDSRFDDVFLPLLGSAVRIILPVVALFFLVRLYPFSYDIIVMFRKVLAVGLIGAVSWLVIRGATLTERAVVGKELRAMTDFEGRALVTRVSVLRKIVIVLTGICALAATLMLFDEVRDIGRSMLASAGVAGIILGFAAQKSLSGLFAGLQIALTQPIRLGDQIRAADETGIVEEITLTYVVLRIWDGRRLIVPINYFIENPIQNHTRNSSATVGYFTLRADFTLPVPELREFMRQCVEQSKDWDRKMFGVQVTGSAHESMEIRIVAGADSPGSAFNIQCELREKALDWMHRYYPQCFPKAREEGKPIYGWQPTEEFGPRDFEQVRRQATADVEDSSSAGAGMPPR